MSKAAESGAASNSSADLPFEQALEKLEASVEAMESEDLPLETLLARFEEGTRLAQMCQRQLGQAEVKIQQLEKDASGQVALKPFNVENEPE
jgi:exodeoxyribonuclease VII small subunit